MLVLETVARIRREHFIKGKTIKEIARDLRVSRNTVRRVLRSGETSFEYEREVQPRPKLGRWTAELDEVLAGNAAKPAREQLTLIRIFEELRDSGYDGGYDAVRRYARRWAKERGQSTAAAYVPLSFAPGEAYQFDWSHEIVLLGGVTVIVKVAHVRLCHSRMLFVRAYPRETQEMVFDAHDRAFALFKGTCGRGIYDNMKTAVETVFVGKDRLYNRRFLQMCSHYLVEPVACTPASGWEKGQVENQVGLVRQRFFTPRLRFKTYEEMNAWLLDKCIAYAKAHHHPELTEQTVWRCSRRSGRSSFPTPVASTDSTPCRPRSRRPAWFASTTTSTRWRRAPSGVRSRFMPMRIVSSSARRGASSPNILARSAAATRSMTPGTTCRCWPASRAPYATARRSRTGCCRPRWIVCGASSPAPMMAIARWSTSSRPCSPTGY